MQLQGEEQFPVSQSELWARISDLQFVSRCIPGLDRVTECSDDVLQCRDRPGLAFLKATLKITIEVLDRQPPRAARMRVSSQGIGTKSEVETAFALSQAGSGDQSETALHWTAEVTRTEGLLKQVSRPLMEAAARKVIADAWAAVRNELQNA